MNVSIPDGAAALGVSETKLRRTLLETAVPTITEFRQTRTGVRKTTVLSVETLAFLRDHFESALRTSQETDSNPRASANAAAQTVNEFFAEPGVVSLDKPTNDAFSDAEHSQIAETEIGINPPPDAGTHPASSPAPGQTVPVTQFNALLYQHNVLREELSRVSEYVEGCDRLLGEMVRTIATLEERTRKIEPARPNKHVTWNPIAGAFSRVSASVQNALFTRRPAASIAPSTEVYYGSVLAGR